MRLTFSVGQRITLGFGLLLTALVAAVGAGAWFSLTTQTTVNNLSRNLAQVGNLADLETSWSTVASTIDSILLTRQVSATGQQLENELLKFDEQLDTVLSLDFESSVYEAQNQVLLDELQLLAAELGRVVEEISQLAEDGRWATAQTLRHTELASFQRRFDEGLNQLRENIRQDVDSSVAETFQAQQVTNRLWLVIVLAAVLVGGAVAFLITRSVSQPVKELIKRVRRVTQRDFTPVAPLSQQDELGQLSQALALMTDWLRESYQVLEDRVAARTYRLELVALLSEQLSSILDLNELLVNLVDQVKEKFNYYHVHVYLLDEAQELLIMTAGFGEAGAKMKAEGHHIPLNASTSLVARAARTGQVVQVDNVREAEDWLPNPLLPDTYSEMAVPIILGEVVVGVLDVQQDTIAGLDEGDANLLRSLANQVAVAIRNARQFEAVETALAEAHATQEKYIVDSWQQSHTVRKGFQYSFVRPGVADLPEEALSEAREKAVSGKNLQLIDSSQDVADSSSILAPIKLGQTPIGSVQLHNLAGSNRQWTQDDLELVEAILDQVAQAAENLRLFNETREKASRERLIGQISNKLRRAPDMETLLQVGLQELSRALSPQRTFIKLGAVSEQNHSASSATSSPIDAPSAPHTQGRATSINGHRAAAENESKERSDG